MIKIRRFPNVIIERIFHFHEDIFFSITYCLKQIRTVISIISVHTQIEAEDSSSNEEHKQLFPLFTTPDPPLTKKELSFPISLLLTNIFISHIFSLVPPKIKNQRLQTLKESEQVAY